LKVTQRKHLREKKEKLEKQKRKGYGPKERRKKYTQSPQVGRETGGGKLGGKKDDIPLSRRNRF